jgi:hypothetical protein
MGWVEDEFLDYEAYDRPAPQLSDTIRIGCDQAVREFNARAGVRQIFDLRLHRARAVLLRAHSEVAERPSIEVFLDAGRGRLTRRLELRRRDLYAATECRRPATRWSLSMRAVR